LLELIQDVVSGSFTRSEAAGKKFPPATASLSVPYAHAASAASGAHSSSNETHPIHVTGSAGQAALAIPFADHHGDQEDYLWGV
jgi:hypothetical protein